MYRRWINNGSALLIVLISAAFPGHASDLSNAPPVKDNDEVARAATAGCHNALKKSDPEPFEFGLCLGVLKGLHYLSSDVCVPPAVSLEDVAGVVSRYLDTHPERIDQDFRETSLEAMRSAWPCTRRQII
jgi:Rap1a immunity proteins